MLHGRGVQEDLNAGIVPVLGGDDQRRGAVRPLHARIGPEGEQQGQAFRAALLGGEEGRRHRLAVAPAEVAASVRKQPNALKAVKRRAAQF